MRWIAPALLILILALATGLRLRGVHFGLPALNDPDEPLFMMTAFDMLRNRSLNPGWFGHPGTITLYCLALICLAVGVFGVLTGRFSGADQFASAVYADPAIVFLPARLFIVLCGVICVYLTFRIGRRLGGERLGLIAAALLAINSIHIEYSQIIRTDMQASVFILLCILAALSIFENGRERNYLLAGLWVGLAAATKWPAALVAIAPLCAGLARLRQGKHEGDLVILSLLAAPVALFCASPYLVLDYPAVLRDLAGEARPIHPGATGGGFLANLAWYLSQPLARSFGYAGLAMSALGLAIAARRDRRWRLVIVPFVLLFLATLSLQHLVWARWTVPILPLLALGEAYALCAAAEGLRSWRVRHAAIAGSAVAAMIMLPMLHASVTRGTERRHDTRQAASAWITTHVPTATTLLDEDAAIDLLGKGHRLLFPLGSAGCIDARQALTGQIEYQEVANKRASSPLVDLGHVARDKIETCRASYAILSHYDRYRAAPDVFPDALARYHDLLTDARLEARFAPHPGSSSGPTTYVFRLAERGCQANKAGPRQC